MINNNQNKFEQLRQTYQTFYYEKYTVKQVDEMLVIRYFFNIDSELFFQPSIKIPLVHIKRDMNDAAIGNMIFHIGLVEMISYWKCACPSHIVIECGHLDTAQVAWWKKLYYYGLGEFFYVNGISTDKDSFVEIKSRGEVCTARFNKAVSGTLCPVGGGKDSVVSLEILQAAGEDFQAMIVNPRGASEQTARLASNAPIIDVYRYLDKNLLELNKQGFLNGHTPFSALLAFLTYLVAALHNNKYIALSNESSANEASTGTVNHQYSKSFEFEHDFYDYTSAYLGKSIHYFSLLRPFSELQIAAMFARFPQYFNAFKSCNVGSRTDVWCGACPKCLFVYTMLAAFLDTKSLLCIFDKNLLDDSQLATSFEQLLGIIPVKPLECVGTRSEVNKAASIAVQQHLERGEDLPFLLAKYQDTFNADFDYLSYFDHQHLIPSHFLNVLKEYWHVSRPR